MFGTIRWIGTKLANYWDFTSWLAGWLLAIGSGIMTGWAASVSNIFPQHAPFSWMMAGLLGAFIAAAIAFLIGLFRVQLVKAAAVAKWSEQVDTLNPLDAEFHKKRIKISDLVHPDGNYIEEKKFTDCELLGPCNIIFYQNATIMHCGFIGCDIVVARDDAQMATAIALRNVQIIGGTLWKCTIIVPRKDLALFKALGARFVTLTGDPSIDEAPFIIANTRTEFGVQKNQRGGEV